jgi:hypothetical protein
MNHPPQIQTRIDSYLINLRKCLGELPQEEVQDILLEIRGHILEQAEAKGELTEARILEILRALGRPEEIGVLYQSEAMIARARASWSPQLILRTTMRWAMSSARGFAIFMLGLVGYGLSLGFLITAFAKPFYPENVGLWYGPNLFSMGYHSNIEGLQELLGWWVVPVGIVFGSLFLVGTTRALRWALKFARPKMPQLQAVNSTQDRL